MARKKKPTDLVLYGGAMLLLEHLMEKGPTKRSADGRLLLALADWIERYEKEHFPIPKP